jgi:DNA-binding XRE family transcriptional regulator
MSDIAALLKGEITRLSKKVVRQHLEPLRSATTAHKRQISALRKQLADLEREVAKLRRHAPAPALPEPAEEGTNVRFVAKGFRSLRSRLGLSAEELAALLGVSGQTVYNWEHERAKPRASQLASIAALRGIGKKEARARLEALNASAAS